MRAIIGPPTKRHLAFRWRADDDLTVNAGEEGAGCFALFVL